MEEVFIRQGEYRDFPILASIISTSKAWTCYGINYDTAIGLFEKMEDTIYVVEINCRQVVGFITLSIGGVGNIGSYVRMVAVDEPYRGQGIGAKLIDYIANLAFQKIPNIFLICSVANVRAQRFYEKTGFVKVGILSDLVVSGHDEIFYRKTAGILR
ncbi:MAG: GNAT family N-acetyltransferase [Desulfotomaculaceae bacterium]|jgi:ribosomal protein S18 acetylase RimI-like enzyme|nr:GNAT family N-acetyltransferase [Desulfotomaculaceae bacterium]